MRLLSIAILVCSVVGIYAQPKPGSELRFRHLTEKDGLSNNVVNTLFKDSRGFLWIGTNEGLDMYDGTSFSVYRHSFIDTFSIEGNDIISIAEDASHQVWVSSHCAGLSILNPFSRKATSDNRLFRNHGVEEVCDIRLQEARHDIWVCNRKMLILCSAAGNRMVSRLFADDEADQSYDFTVNGKTVWIGHRTGVIEFDTTTKKSLRHDDWTDSGLCSVIRVFPGNNLLLGTWQNGLFVVNPKTGLKKQFLNGSIINDIARVTFAGRDQLWIASNNGLYTADLPADISTLAESDFKRFVNDRNDPFSLSSTAVNCILPDSGGVIWVGTPEGINIFNPSYLQFPTVSVKQHSAPFTTTQLGYALAEKDPAGNRIYDLCYWHGTGFLQTDSAFNISRQLTFRDAQQQLLIVSSCIRGRDGNLWLSTWDGLWCYDDRNGKLIRSYKTSTPGRLHLSSNKTDYLLQDRKGRFWVGTYGYGLNMLDIRNDTSYVFLADGKKGSVLSNRCDFIFEDSKGNIWIAGPALQKFNEVSRDFTTYSPRRADPSSLPGGVNSIIEDRRRQLWIATDGGLSKFEPVTQSFHTYTTKDGLPSDECESLLEDEYGNIWVTTSGGLGNINTHTGIITSFTTNDGLPTNQLGNVIVPASGGEILFSLAGPNSPLIAFNPHLQPQQQKIPFHFTGISVLGAEQYFDRPVDSMHGLRLSYRQNLFSISFKALDFTNPGEIRYKCMLRGFDKDWIDLGHRNYITYTNLDGGSYTFLVKATNAKGEWLKKGLSLDIVITPPFWKTWWFYGASLVLLVVVIYVIFRVRLDKIRKEGEKKAAIAREIAELEMKALKAQMNPHFIFNALSSIQESIVNGKAEAAAKYLGKFSRLIRFVLDFSDKKLITLEQEIDYLTLYLELESFRFEDFHFSITVIENTDHEFVRIPPMLVQPFIENAIKHGLSHKSGEKKLAITFQEQDGGFLKVTINDNGIGRAEAALHNVFRNPSRQSMGIKITSRRLQLMNDNEAPLMNIKDKTKQDGDTGTEVTLIIPIETIV